MKARIHFKVGEEVDSFVVEGSSVEEIREQAEAELSRRGGTDPCSEIVDDCDKEINPCCANSDRRELWRAVRGDYYAPSAFVTSEGGIGMNHGGTVFVMTVEEWIKRAESFIRDDEDICGNCEGGMIAYNPNLNPNNFKGISTAPCTRCNGTGIANKEEK